MQNITGLGINIKVKDISISRTFYESLGFVPVFAYGDANFLAKMPQDVPTALSTKPKGIHYALYADPEKKYAIAELELVANHIVLKDKDTFQETVESAKLSAMIHVISLLPIITNPNINIVFPIRKYYWESIELAIRDPDGFVLVFIAPFSQEELDNIRQIKEVEIIDNEEQLV